MGTFDAALFLTYHYFNETHSIKVVVIIIISNRYTVFYQPKMSIIPRFTRASSDKESRYVVGERIGLTLVKLL